jgi:hypothetical protein
MLPQTRHFLRESRTRDEWRRHHVGANRLARFADLVCFICLESMKCEAVFMRVDRNRTNAEFVRGTENANSDFTSIGDHQLANGIGSDFGHLAVLQDAAKAKKPSQVAAQLWALGLKVKVEEVTDDPGSAVFRTHCPTKRSGEKESNLQEQLHKTAGPPLADPRGCPAFLRPEISTQRESKPHVLHGEQASGRYITGAKRLAILGNV